jgi:hypothetical protein
MDLQHATHDTTFQALLGCPPRPSMTFSEFLQILVEEPAECLRTSASLIWEAIRHFGYEVVIRSGEPTINYKVFQDPFGAGTNAVFGQEFCIQQVVNAIESVAQESGPNRGLVLVGPPASGKTNIVDLISLALEEYTKQQNVRLYSFYFHFEGADGQMVEYRPTFWHNPVLIFPTSLQKGCATSHPRQELFEYINRLRGSRGPIQVSTYYRNATLDKRSLDLLESLRQNPRNRAKTLYQIVEEYVRVEEVEFSVAQAKGIANIDDMRRLTVGVEHLELGGKRHEIVQEHAPGSQLCSYRGATVAANRGLLHIHDAFGSGEGGSSSDEEYKPLLMLLGSGKVSVEATQTPIDTTVVLTTNVEEMSILEKQLTSSKLLDRIEEIAVRYLLDANSEMEILRRDMANMRPTYDIDPNLVRVASYFSVLTRLLPPRRKVFPPNWSEEKKRLYLSVTPEQKLFIYAAQPEDPVGTIRDLPHWHRFRSEMAKLGIDPADEERLASLIAFEPGRWSLAQSEVFSREQLKLIDDEFMRLLREEHYPHEGKHGMSVRQLQNLMRDTFANSGAGRVHVGTFFAQVDKLFSGSPKVKRWLPMEAAYTEGAKPLAMRLIGSMRFAEGEGGYGSFKDLAKVTRALYNHIIRHEIVEATVGRDPEEIALDLRRYLQHALLAKAVENRAFAHIMVPRFTFVDPASGEKVDRPDRNFMESLEKILGPNRDPLELRREMAQRFLDLQASDDLGLEEGRSIVTSRGDAVLSFFGTEYNRLLSHRRTMGSVSPDQLTDAFFLKRQALDKYEQMSQEVRELVEIVLSNMERRFGYSRQSALETVVFALRTEVLDFADVIS